MKWRICSILLLVTLLMTGCRAERKEMTAEQQSRRESGNAYETLASNPIETDQSAEKSEMDQDETEDEKPAPVREAEMTITEYYKALMIAYLGDDSSVVEPYLDLSELQSQNVMNALECISFSQQYLMEEYGQEDIREDVPYEITFDSVEVKDNTCEVKISLRLLPHETDAPFLSGGEEVFHLKWLEGRWKISRHEWNGIDGFELFTDEVYQFDKEQRKKLLDDMMSWPKEGKDISE